MLRKCWTDNRQKTEHAYKLTNQPKDSGGLKIRTPEKFAVITLKFEQCSFITEYRNDPKFSDRQVSANGIDPDQTAPRGAV